MALSPLSRRAVVLCFTAAVLIVLSQVMSVLVGAIATAGLYTVGWTLFGIAALRARAFPSAAALLLIADDPRSSSRAVVQT
jgi:hypothetical protein